MTPENERCVNKPGAPTLFSAEKAAIIVEEVRDNLSINNAARIARVNHQTPHNWMKKGIADKEKGLNTEYVQFLDNIREAQGQKVRQLMKTVEKMPKQWQAISWLLEKCCAEDFGKDSELYKQLLDDYKMLMQSLIDQNKGVNNGGQKA